MAARNRSHLRWVVWVAPLLAALAGQAVAQSVTPSKQVFDGGETVEINYSVPDSCPRCELHIVSLSDNLRHENFDAWVRQLFLQPAVTHMPVFYVYSAARERLEVGASGVFRHEAWRLRARTDRGRGWYRALLISDTTQIIAQAPFLVIHRHAGGAGKAELLDPAGLPLERIAGAQAPLATLSGDAGGAGAVIHADVWRRGAATPVRSWNNSADRNQRSLRLGGLPPGTYEIRFRNQFPGTLLSARVFDVAWPYRADALSLSWPRGTAAGGAQLPQVAIDYPGSNFLNLYRLDGMRQERLWGWVVPRNGSLDLADRLPNELRNLPPGDYELRLYMAYNEDAGRYLLARKGFAIAGDKPASAPSAPQAQLALADDRPVLAGDSFEVSYSLPAGDAQQVWLALFPKTRILPGCTVFEQAPPMAVVEGRFGNAQFRYPVTLSGSGSLSLLAPWQPGEYELRIYRGEVRMQPRFLAETKASLLAALPVTVELAQPLLTMTTSIGQVVPLGSPIELEIAPSSQLRRELFRSWRVQATIVRATEKLPGGATLPEQIVQTLEALDATGGKVRLAFKPIDLDPGPYELQVSASAPDNNFLRFLARHRFDVPPPPEPALPGDATFARIPGFTTPDGYSPSYGSMPDCATPVASVPPPPKQPEDQPSLRVVEWIGGEESTDADDSYRPVAAIFPGYPYMIEARFSKPREAPSHLVAGPGNAVITLRRTSDPLVYRSELVVLAAEPPR